MRRALYSSKERVVWLRNVFNLLRIPRGKNVVFSSEARCATELKHPNDIYRFLRFAGLSKRRAETVANDNPTSLLRSAALRRYTFKGCVATSLEEGNLKRDFILNEFEF